MAPKTVVATANVLRSLGTAQARDALTRVLAEEPDLVALQEWEVYRLGLLRETGAVTSVPSLGLTLSPKPGTASYRWSASFVGGCVVGARADRYDGVSARAVLLSPPGRADNPVRPLGLEPPRIATVGTYRDREDGSVVSLVSYHLVPGAQGPTGYRADRPELVARHRREVRRLQELVRRVQRQGHTVYAAGDSNLDGLRLAGLTSAWVGRGSEPGTHGDRKIDDVHGPGPAASVVLLASASDHKAVVATRARPSR